MYLPIRLRLALLRLLRHRGQRLGARLHAPYTPNVSTAYSPKPGAKYTPIVSSNYTPNVSSKCTPRTSQKTSAS
eukprot:2227888-Rhodomonas_salina.1